LSVLDTLLVFLGKEGGVSGWLRLAEGAVAERGTELEPVQAPGQSGAVAAIVPGDEVAIHWLELPGGLAPAQAVAAARLMALEVSAQPIGEMHVAIGPEAEGSALRCVALAPLLTMTEWIGRLQALGLDPDLIVPEPLLLPVPEEGFVRYALGGASLYRGPTEAFAIEPHLAEIALAGRAAETVDDAAFEAGLAAAVGRLPVNLRQGAFAKRRRWVIDWRRVRRLAQLALAILLVTIAIQIASPTRITRLAPYLTAARPNAMAPPTATNCTSR